MIAPRVTIEEINNAIHGETYTVLPDGRTTVCQLTLDNGFTVTGISVCASPENFNEAEGNKYARERAVDQVWMLMGFRLLEQERNRGTRADRLKFEHDEAEERLGKLRSFMASEDFELMTAEEKMDLTEQASYMSPYLATLKRRLARITGA